MELLSPMLLILCLHFWFPLFRLCSYALHRISHSFLSIIALSPHFSFNISHAGSHAALKFYTIFFIKCTLCQHQFQWFSHNSNVPLIGHVQHFSFIKLYYSALSNCTICPVLHPWSAKADFSMCPNFQMALMFLLPHQHFPASLSYIIWATCAWDLIHSWIAEA